MGASTDCLDLDSDRDKTPRRHSPVQCGHAPGNERGAVINTGVLWFKSCPEAISLARQWSMATLHLRRSVLSFLPPSCLLIAYRLLTAS